jgi:hypothetical protein
MNENIKMDKTTNFMTIFAEDDYVCLIKLQPSVRPHSLMECRIEKKLIRPLTTTGLGSYFIALK